MANPALSEVFGKSYNEIIGRTDSEYYNSEPIGKFLRQSDLQVMKSVPNSFSTALKKID